MSCLRAIDGQLGCMLMSFRDDVIGPNDTIEEFKRQMFEKYNRIDPSPDIEYKVVEIIITSMIEHTTTTTQQQDIPMKSDSQLMYNYIYEYKDFLQDTGTCVIDNFIGMFGLTT